MVVAVKLGVDKSAENCLYEFSKRQARDKSRK